jgi:hypothetical protein
VFPTTGAVKLLQAAKQGMLDHGFEGDDLVGLEGLGEDDDAAACDNWETMLCNKLRDQVHGDRWRVCVCVWFRVPPSKHPPSIKHTHTRTRTPQVVNTVSASAASGHLAQDMGLDMGKKKYAFGVTFERVPPQAASAGAGNGKPRAINAKFRILLVSEELFSQVPCPCFFFFNGWQNQDLKKRKKKINCGAAH